VCAARPEASFTTWYLHDGKVAAALTVGARMISVRPQAARHGVRLDGATDSGRSPTRTAIG
jgi:hypothetical protein